MDHTTPRVRDFEGDIESGVTGSEEDSSKVPVSGAKKQVRTYLEKICSGFVDGSIKNEDKVGLCGIVSDSNGFSPENVKMVSNKILEGEEAVDYVEKTLAKEKHKNCAS